MVNVNILPRSHIRRKPADPSTHEIDGTDAASVLEKWEQRPVRFQISIQSGESSGSLSLELIALHAYKLMRKLT